MAPRPKPITHIDTAEFKLAVVLEYVRDPKRKQQICQEKGISELLFELVD